MIPRLDLAIVAVATVLLLGGERPRPAPSGAKPGASAAAKRTERDRNATPRMPSTRRAPIDPVETAQLVRKVDIPGSVSAVISAESATVARGNAVALRMDLYDAAGEPLSGRRDVEILVDPGGGVAPFKGAFVEELEPPGVYLAHVILPPRAERADLLVMISETGDPSAPGRMESVRLPIQLE